MKIQQLQSESGGSRLPLAQVLGSYDGHLLVKGRDDMALQSNQMQPMYHFVLYLFIVESELKRQFRCANVNMPPPDQSIQCAKSP